MALISNINLAYKDLSGLSADNEYVNCNLTQAVPETPIPAAIYRHCNLMNCAPATGAVVEDCMTIQKSLCFWLYAEYDNEGQVIGNPLQLPVEAENCSHVTDIIDIDGVKIYERNDTLIGGVPSTSDGWAK